MKKNNKKSRSLITGITGFVGSHLAEYLLSIGEEIYGIKRSTSSLDNLKAIYPKINLLDADLLDSSSMLKALNDSRPDYVYHLAAQSHIPFSFLTPKTTIETNILGALNLLEAVRILNLNPIIHFASSSDVYGQVEKNEIPIKEAGALKPVTPYAVSKSGQDLLAYSYFKSYGIKVITTRALSQTGPRRGQFFAESAFAKQIAEIEKGLAEPIVRVGNLNSLRTYVDVRDIVKAYYLIVRKGKPGQIYNVGGNQTVKMSYVLDILLSLSDRRDIKIIQEKRLVRRADKILPILDTKSLTKLTGWKPEIKLEQSLSDLLNFWRERVE